MTHVYFTRIKDEPGSWMLYYENHLVMSLYKHGNMIVNLAEWRDELIKGGEKNDKAI